MPRALRGPVQPERGNERESLMVGIIVELIAVFSIFCAALWFGAAWPYLVFPPWLGLLSLKITPLGKKFKVSRLFLAIMAVGLGIGLVVGHYVFILLTEWSSANPDNNIIRFFFGPQVLRLLWSVMLGLFAAFDVLALTLLPLAYFSAQGKYGDFEVYKENKRQGIRVSLFGLLGLSQGTAEVREGRIEAIGKMADGFTRLGGPGELIVQQGHAVVLTKNGMVSNLALSGLTWIKPFEVIAMVVPLYLRSEQVKVQNVLTRDRVVIQEIEILVWHKVDASPEHAQLQDGIYAYNPLKIVENVWAPGKTDWRDAIKAVTERMTREVCGRYPLDFFMPLAEGRRTEFRDVLQGAIQEVATKFAVVVSALDVGRVDLPRDIQEQLNARWGAILEYEVLNQRAETERDIQIKRAQARMQTIQAVTSALRQINDSGASASDLVALEFIDHLEKQANAGTSDTDALIKLQGLANLRVLEAPPKRQNGSS